MSRFDFFRGFIAGRYGPWLGYGTSQAYFDGFCVGAGITGYRRLLPLRYRRWHLAFLISTWGLMKWTACRVGDDRAAGWFFNAGWFSLVIAREKKGKQSHPTPRIHERQ